MSNKKRFFHVVSNIDGGITATSAVCRVDGTIFNSRELRQQLATENQRLISEINIVSWIEFDSERDYLDFHA